MLRFTTVAANVANHYKKEKTMITEIAEIQIQPGTAEKFEAAVKAAAPLFKRSRGCHSMRLARCIERPEHYRLLVEWETLEDHEVHFRSSEQFQEWRKLAGPFFVAAPQVYHIEAVSTGF